MQIVGPLLRKKEKDRVCLKLISEDGDQGFPGNCENVVDYKLIDNEFQMEIKAEVSKPCPINISYHAYFNLDGKRSDVRDHSVFIDASHYLPNSYRKEVPSVAAIAVSSNELLKMEVCTKQQGLQFYTGNFIGSTPCRDGGVYEAYEALCFDA